MKYVVTFESYGECESVVANEAYYIDAAIEQAMEKTNNKYEDYDIVSIVRI